MDDNLAWKIVYMATIFSLIVLGFAYYFISPKDSLFFNQQKTEKIAEFQKLHLSGHKEAKKNWDFLADGGWTETNREITHLQNIKEGKIFKNGKLIIKNIYGPQGKVFQSSEQVEVSNDGSRRISALINISKISSAEGKKNDWVKLTSDSLRFYSREKKSEAQGNIKIVKKGEIITADRLEMLHEQKIANFSGNIGIKRRQTTLLMDNLQYFVNDERFNATGHIFTKTREKKILTEISADRADFFTDDKKPITLYGNVQVVQGKKLALANEGVYLSPDKTLTLKGNAKAIFSKANILFRPESIKTLDNPESKDILKQKTVLTSGNLLFSTKSGDLKAWDQVFVTQNSREAKSDDAVYNDKDEKLILTGNVFYKSSGLSTVSQNEWIRCQKVIIFIRKESFEALGSVEAEFKL